VVRLDWPMTDEEGITFDANCSNQALSFLRTPVTVMLKLLIQLQLLTKLQWITLQCFQNTNCPCLSITFMSCISPCVFPLLQFFHALPGRPLKVMKQSPHHFFYEYFPTTKYILKARIAVLNHFKVIWICVTKLNSKTRIWRFIE